jgi:hypothetical protein
MRILLAMILLSAGAGLLPQTGRAETSVNTSSVVNSVYVDASGGGSGASHADVRVYTNVNGDVHEVHKSSDDGQPVEVHETFTSDGGASSASVSANAGTSSTAAPRMRAAEAPALGAAATATTSASTSAAAANVPETVPSDEPPASRTFMSGFAASVAGFFSYVWHLF